MATLPFCCARRAAALVLYAVTVLLAHWAAAKAYSVSKLSMSYPNCNSCAVASHRCWRAWCKCLHLLCGTLGMQVPPVDDVVAAQISWHLPLFRGGVSGAQQKQSAQSLLYFALQAIALPKSGSSLTWRSVFRTTQRNHSAHRKCMAAARREVMGNGLRATAEGPWLSQRRPAPRPTGGPAAHGLAPAAHWAMRAPRCRAPAR